METKTIDENRYWLQISGSEIKVEQQTEFDSSFFREEYIQIFKVIDKIIQSTESNRKREKEAKESRKYCPDIRIHNIVPIIGRRGAGKSSILHAVSGALSENFKNKKNDSIFEKFSNSNFVKKKFIVMQCIDGSLLEENEDIFPIVLAQMYNIFKKISDKHFSSGFNREYENAIYEDDQDYQRRELNKRFTELYRSAMQVADDQYHDYWSEGMTPISSLNQLSGSLELRQNFRALLKSYLRYYAKYGKTWDEDDYKQDDYYLVIPIDDLDLNVEHGFEMLEKIHRYLMVPNVIILLAHDQKQFKRLSEFHFYKMIPKYDSRMNAASSNIEGLTNQFLEKVMPRNYRVYVPEFSVRRERWVSIANGNDEEKYSPRNIVFRLLYKRLGMRMDVVGTKRHFFEYESLRYFTNFVNLLNDMDSPAKENFGNCHYLKMSSMSSKIPVDCPDDCEVSPSNTSENENSFNMEVFRHNYRLLKQEITEVMSENNLSGEAAIYQYRVDNASVTSTSYAYQTRSSKKKFDEIISEVNPIPKIFVNLYDTIVNEGSQAEANDYRNFVERLKFFDYSYGEVLYIIYKYGRMYGNKGFIHCLLAEYSLELMRNYVHIRFDNDYKRRHTERKNLILAVNGSVAGSWANSMMPIILFNEGMNRSFSGTIGNVVMQRVFAIDGSLIKELIDEKISNKKELEIEITNILHTILIIGMFFDCRSYKLPKMFNWNVEDMQKKVSSKDADDIYNKMDNRAVSNSTPPVAPSSFRPISGLGTFSFLNFVGNALKYKYIDTSGKKNASVDYDAIKDDKDNYDDNLSLLLDYAVRYINRITGNNRVVKNVVNKVRHAIEKDLNGWHKKYEGFVLPIYDIDIFYNLLKRLVEDSYGKPGTIALSDLLYRYIEAYRFLEKKLAENDMYYADKKQCRIALCPDGRNAYHYHFSQAFREYPLMKWLGVSNKKVKDSASIKAETGIKNEWFESIFENMGMGGFAGRENEPNSNMYTIKSKWFEKRLDDRYEVESRENSNITINQMYNVSTIGGYGD